ncbi:MalY/PatB family protein [Streptomyces luteireticuli]|uniref:cysteine-S-conjugate beta-lyase n=1 Tax=Streptomyces luteireticuli TaxID=173858 RepID=A0ABP3IR03_9ACTN
MTRPPAPSPGPAAPARPTGDRLKWETAGPGGLGACAAEMDYGTAPAVTAALRTAVTRDQLGYLTPSLAARAGAACAAWQDERYGWRVDPEDVRLLPDVVRAFHVAVAHFSRPGSPVIVPVPAYTPFLTVPGLLGRPVLQVELVRSGGRYVYDLDALDRAYAAGGHLLVLCNPHNPLGRVMERGELLAVSEVVERHGGRVFADEVHAPLVLPGHRHVPYASVSPTAARHALTATSASKGWNLAGLKCAQVLLTNDADRDRWARLGRLATDGTATPGAVAAVAAYRSGRPWLESVLAQLNDNRRLLAELLAEHLPGVGYVPPEGTFLGWLDFRGLGLPEDGLAEFFARRAGVTLVDGTDCGPPGRGFVRLNFATTPEVLTQIVERLAAAAG